MSDFDEFGDEELEDEVSWNRSVDGENFGDSIDLSEQDIDDETRQQYIALGVLDLLDMVARQEDVDPSSVRSNRFVTFGEALRHVVSTGIATFTTFIYQPLTRYWLISVEVDSDKVNRVNFIG